MEKVLYNIDMLDCIVKYLRFREILALRLVCSQLSSTIVHCPNLLKRGECIVNISPQCNGSVDLLQLPLFKSVSLTAEEISNDFNQAEQESAAALLNGAKKMILRLTSSELLSQVSSLDHLRILHLSYETLKSVDFQNSNTFNANVFQRLQKFGFCDSILTRFKNYDGIQHDAMNLKVMQNLQWLSSVCTSLTSFFVGEFSMPDLIDRTLTDYNRAMNRFIEVNSEHLTSLKIGDWRIWTFPFFDDVKLPMLKICSINAPEKNYDMRHTISFLRNHPFLEELSIISSRLDVFIINLFRGRRNCLKSLKLQINMCHPNNYNHSQERWSFLNDYKILETFSLRVANCYCNENPLGTTITPYLSEDSLKKICIVSPCAPQKHDNRLYQILLAKSYEQLRCLDLSGTEFGGNTITNQDLQVIFKEMTYLLKLKLEHCKDITDSGITGAVGTSSTTQFNISNLRELTVLKLTKCPKLTCAVMGNIFFNNLRKLTIGNFSKGYGSGQGVEEYVKTIIFKNPSLEKLYLQENHGQFPEISESEKSIIKRTVFTTLKSPCIIKFIPYYNYKCMSFM